MTSALLNTQSKRQRRVQPLEVAAQADALLHIGTVCVLTSYSEMTIRRMVACGTFPAPVRYSARCVRWPARRVREWLAAQSAA